MTDPANPAVVGQTATRPDGTSNAADVVIHERLAYVADGAQRILGGLRIVDFRDPTNPVVVGSSGDRYGLTSVAFDRGLILASDYFFVNAVPIFGGDPGTVPLRSLVDFSSYNDDGIRNVEIFVDGVPRAILLSPFQWTFSAPPAGTVTRIQAVAEDTRFQHTASPEITITSIPDPGTAIHGRTVDAAGTPLAGAQVEAGGSFVVSGPDGTFLLANLPTNAGDLSLTASAVVNGFTFHGDLAEPVTPAPGDVVEVGDVVLAPDDPGTTIRGVTVDEAGASVAGATVKIYDNVFLGITTSGPDGSFALAGAPSFGSLTLSAFATVGGLRLRGGSGVSPGGEADTDAGTVVLSPVEETNDPGTTVTGAVVDEAGLPVPGARVHVFTSFDVFPALTASDGTLTIPNVPALDGDLSASVSTLIDGVLADGDAFAAAVPGGVTDFGTIVLRLGGGVRLLAPPFAVPRDDLRLASTSRGGLICKASNTKFAFLWGGR